MPTASASALLEIRASRVQRGQNPPVDVVELGGPNILRRDAADAPIDIRGFFGHMRDDIE